VIRVAAIVVHYGRTEPCLRCLDSIDGSGGIRPLPIVVDQNPAESPPIAEKVTSRGGRYVFHPQNSGFGGGGNIGLRLAMEEREVGILAVLNSDVRVSPDCLETLAACLDERRDVGVCGPAIVAERAPETWWNFGSEILWPSGRPRSLRHGERLDRQGPGALPLEETSPFDVGFVCGSISAFRPDLVRNVGMLPEHYFLYFEDADFSFRVRRAGLRTIVVPKALAWHLGGASLEEAEDVTPYYRARNRLIFSSAWNPCRVRGRAHRILFSLRAVTGGLVRFLATGRRSALLPPLGVLDYLRGRHGKRRFFRDRAAHPRSDRGLARDREEEAAARSRRASGA